MRTFLKYLSVKDWLLVALSLAFIALRVFLDLALPDYMSEITELVETEGSELGEILHTGKNMLLTALASLLASVATAVCVSALTASFGASVREALFDSVQAFSLNEMARFSTASLITRSTNDVMQLQLAIVLCFEAAVMAPVKAVWAVFKIGGGAAEWTLAMAVAAAVLVLLFGVCIAVCMPKFKKMQALADDLTRITREGLEGVQVVRAFHGEAHETERFEEANERLTKTHLFTAHGTAVLAPTIQLVNNVLTLGAYFVGAALISAATDAAARLSLFSDTVVFLSYALQIVSAFLLMVAACTLFPRAFVSGKRILKVLHTKASILDGEVDTAPTGKGGTVRFEGVGFSYPGAPRAVLQDVSFEALAGETVGILGAAGGGKSSVVQLIPRFYDATAGAVFVDGVNVKDYTLRALHARIGYVPSAPHFLSGTIEENVAFGKGGGEKGEADKLARALSISGADALVARLPEGLSTHVFAEGANLSEGEAVSLAIARAVLGRPEILIFDDVFCHFDTASCRRILENVKRECAGTTCLIVARQPSTVRHADKILVMEGGRVAGFGTHEALLDSSPAYRRLLAVEGEVTAK